MVSRRPHLYVSFLLIHVETVLKVCLLSVKPGSPLSTGQHSTPSKASLSGWAPPFSFKDEMRIDGPYVPREETPGRAEIGVVGLIPLEHPFSLSLWRFANIPANSSFTWKASLPAGQVALEFQQRGAEAETSAGWMG